MSTVVKFEKATIFQDERPVIGNLDLEIQKGEFVYLLGKTGSGKSSLLNTIYADLPLINGNGTIAGYNLTSLKSSDIPYLRRKLGIVFQDFQLLGDATFYNWRSKYGGMEVSEAKRLKQLEDENAKLKRLLADSVMDVSTLREMLGKNF